jgi:hypothetical protein
LTGIARFMRPGSTSYTAADVIRVLLNTGSGVTQD